MWTPRQTTKKFPLRVAAPKIRYPYKPPKPPKKRMTIKEAMTIEGAEVLAGMARSWLEEADRIERETPEPTFEQKIGDYLLQQNVRIDALMRSWDDVLADGSIVKGEFRIKLRQLKPDATSAEIDQLFDSYDEDGGGAIDAVEMKGAFLRLKEQAKQVSWSVLRQASRQKPAHTKPHTRTLAHTYARIHDDQPASLASGKPVPPIGPPKNFLTSCCIRSCAGPA